MNTTLFNKAVLGFFINMKSLRVSFLSGLFLLLCNYNDLYAQQPVKSYTFDEEFTGLTYTPITGTVAYANGWVHNGAVAPYEVSLPPGFVFNYNGVNYTSIYIYRNGFVSVGGSFGPATLAALSGTGTTPGNIAAFAAAPGLTSGSPASEITYDIIGTAPNRQLVVQWKDAERVSLGTDGGLLNFQIRLNETTNVIEYWYDVVTGITDNGTNTQRNGQIGLRGTSNNFNNSILNRTTDPLGGAWPPTSEGEALAATRVIRLNANTAPTDVVRFIWTPPCYEPSALTFTLAGLSANIGWTAPASVPADGYDYEIRSSGAPGSGPSGLVLSGNTATTSLTGLAVPPGTTMTLYVRSNCGGGRESNWLTGPTRVTPCNAANIPYYQDFTFADVPAIPACTTRYRPGGGNDWVTGEDMGGMTGKHLLYAQHFTEDADTWFFTQGINLTAGETYKISYRYGGSSLSTVENDLEVSYGSPVPSPTPAQMAAAMTLPLANHVGFRDSPHSNSVNFVAPSTGVFYFGFYAYSEEAQGQIYVDDIAIEVSTCYQPEDLVVGTVNSTSAFISWDPVIPAPAGYEYYVSTSATPPSSGALPTGTVPGGTNFVNLTGLNGSTTYYFWVRATCGGIERSLWSASVNFTTDAPLPYCTPVATSALSYISNFTTTGGSLNINNSSGFSPGGYGDYTHLVVSQAQEDTVNFVVTMNNAGGHRVAIWVDWNQDGTFEASERMLNVTSYNFTNTQAGSFDVPDDALPGNTRMRVLIDYWGGGNDNTPCEIYYLLGDRRGEVEDYTFNVMPAPPPLTINMSSSQQCAGTDSPTVEITDGMGFGQFNTFVWSPATGVTEIAPGEYVFNTLSTTVYTLTASQTSPPFGVRTVTFTYLAVPPPTPIVITPASASTCASGPAVELVATGGLIGGGGIAFSEDFETGAVDWTRTNTTTGGNPASAAWTIRNSPFVPSSAAGIWGESISSNDFSQYMLTNSDAPGSGTTTNVTLVSPTFDLSSYTQANLSFWHYYRAFDLPEFGVVEISTDGGATWPVGNILATYNSNTGTATNFANANLNLNAYVGQSNLKLRFRYSASWDWGWAIDNIVVSGVTSATTDIYWSPAAGLYLDAAATIPYNSADPADTVYALPGTTTTYTASVNAGPPFNCETTQTVEVVVDDVVEGVVSSDQTICSGVPEDLTLSGHTGTIVRWESADNAAFTVGVTPISNTTATLTSAEMMPITDVKYFRAVVSNGTCEEATAPVEISYLATVWNGSSWSNSAPDPGIKAIINVAGSYVFNSNLEACSLEVLSGNITVAPGVTFDIENEVIVSGGSLIFENNSSLLQHNGTTADNSGAITYKRNSTGMWQHDYTYWSSPVANQDMHAFSPFTTWSRIYTFDGSDDVNQYYWVQVFPTAGSFVPGSRFSTPGVGFIMRAPSGGPDLFYPFGDPNGPTIFEGIFNGVPNNGDVTVTGIDGNGPNFGNYIGNPYPSAIDIHAFLLDASNTNVDGTIYLWTHNTPITNNVYNQDDFATYNFSGGVGTGDASLNSGVNNATPHRYISAGQGFFIDGATGVNNGSVVFRNAHRVAGNNSLFFRTSDSSDYAVSSADAIESLERNRIWLNMTNGVDLEKQLLVGYIESATNDYDRGFDGKIANSGYNLEFYSLQSDNKLAIQARSLPFSVTDEVPLGYKANAAGNYSIYIHDMDGFFPNQEVYLEDKYLNIIHDLKAGSYSFTTESGTSDNRFVLRYTNETLSTGTPQLTGNTVVVYKNNGVLYINTGNVTMQEVSLYDVRGRLLANRKDINAADTSFTDLMISEQVLLVHITDVNGNKVTKKVVF